MVTSPPDPVYPVMRIPPLSVVQVYWAWATKGVANNNSTSAGSLAERALKAGRHIGPGQQLGEGGPFPPFGAPNGRPPRRLASSTRGVTSNVSLAPPPELP
jgi:hypothetical protein